MGRLATIFMVAGAALGVFLFFTSKGGGPASEEERLIRLAAERGIFVFGMHHDAQDWALMDPFVEEAFREVRARGGKVVFVDEVGSVGVPKDTATGAIPPTELWLAEIERDPAAMEAKYRERVAALAPDRRTILDGEFYAPGSYEHGSGGFVEAMHAFLIRNRDLLAGFEDEALSWEDYRDRMRIDVLEERSLGAYRSGRPDLCEQLLRQARDLQDSQQASRDRHLLLQMGRLLDGKEDLTVLTVRGVGHWPMVVRHDLKRVRRPGWESLFVDPYGLSKVDLRLLRGDPVGEEEERRAGLAQCAGMMLHGHLRNAGMGDREATRRVRLAMEHPGMTLEVLRELSLALGRMRLPDDAKVCAFVADWLADRGFLK